MTAAAQPIVSLLRGFPHGGRGLRAGGGDGEQRALCIQAAAERRTKTSFQHKERTCNGFQRDNPFLTCTLINVSRPAGIFL